MEHVPPTAVSSWKLVMALVFFSLTYLVIITEFRNRAVAALAGATGVVLTGVLPLEEALTTYIEWKTIALLVGMMIIVGITNKTGLFPYLAVRAAKWAKGDPLRILLALSALTAGLSAFLDNVTTVLLMVPVTFSLTRILDVNPVPFLIVEVLASNIGGTATLIGDPPNIMIGSAKGNEHLTFNAFLFNLGPAVVIILVITLALVSVRYRRHLVVSEEKKRSVLQLDERAYIQHPSLLKKSVAVLSVTIVGFLLHSVVHLEPAVIAMAGATLLLLIGVDERDVETTFHSVEWVSIFFFVGLFVLVGSLQHVGVIKWLATQALAVTGHDIERAAYLILWLSGVVSAFVDNIPFVATMIPLIQDLGHGMGYALQDKALEPLWWALALGACLGGNGTLIGASANVVVAGMAAREGVSITFWRYLAVGAPLTFVSLLVSHLYLWLRYFLMTGS